MSEVRLLSAAAAERERDALSEVLADCVAGGASVSFMAPFSTADAHAWWGGVIANVAADKTVLFGAYVDGALVGTVQLGLDVPPNQPHRGEIAKLLVRRSARGRGVAARLMAEAEREALAEGKTLLVLDAVTGGDAARLYDRLGWTTVGVVPNYALYPDGRPCDTTVFWKAL